MYPGELGLEEQSEVDASELRREVKETHRDAGGHLGFLAPETQLEERVFSIFSSHLENLRHTARCWVKIKFSV